MLKNIIIYSFIGIYSATYSISQINLNPPEEKEKVENNDTVYVDILDNNTSDFKLFRVLLPIISFNLSTTNSSLYTLDGGLFYDVNRFNLQADCSYKLLDKMFPMSNRDDEYNKGNIVFGKYNPTHANHVGASGSYYLSSKELETRYRFTLARGYASEQVTYVDGIKTKRKGIRFGFEKGVTFMSLSKANLIGKDLTDPNHATRQFQYDDMSTMMEYTNLSIGFAIATTYNMRTHFKGYGKRSEGSMEFLNFDLLININNKLDDVYGTLPETSVFENSTININAHEFNIDELTKKMPFGFKVSYRYIPLLASVSYSFEAGYAPGVMSKLNLFGNVKIQLSLGNRVLVKNI